MLRAFLLLLFSVLLTLGTGLLPSQGALAGAVDCCPDTEEPGDPELPDCCDFDYGACCASSLAVLSPSPRAQERTQAFGPKTAATLSLPSVYQTRANDPPPTPPPIA